MKPVVADCAEWPDCAKITASGCRIRFLNASWMQPNGWSFEQVLCRKPIPRRTVSVSTFSDLNGSGGSSTSAPKLLTILKGHSFCNLSARRARPFLTRTSSEHGFTGTSALELTDLHSERSSCFGKLMFLPKVSGSVSPQLWQDMSSAWSLLRYAPSPPTRGAWIETPPSTPFLAAIPVAPHAGGVD